MAVRGRSTLALDAVTPSEVITLAEGCIAHWSRPHVWDSENILRDRDRSDTRWVEEKLYEVRFHAPVDLWEVILAVVHRTDDMDVLGILAAGPLENFLVDCGDKAIERVEALAAADHKFKHLLGGVWRNSMSDDLWRRICACRGDPW